MPIQSIKILRTDLLSDNKYLLKKITYEYLDKEGLRQVQQREVYDRGNGAAILLYNTANRSVILTRQFRLPTFVNGNESGILIEACAGLLDKDNPEDAIRRETEEETGYKVHTIQKVLEAYMSPGSVTEILYFFIAEYNAAMKVAEGGGLPEEQENIDVLELPFDEAFRMTRNGGIKDAKTILLLQHLRLENIL
jgi:GDP-mannose pyrophosphatase NudK